MIYKEMSPSGAHGSPGAFLGFLLPVVGGVIISTVMLTGKIFSRASAYTGIFGGVFLLVYLVLVTFVPKKPDKEAACDKGLFFIIITLIAQTLFPPSFDTSSDTPAVSSVPPI